MIERSALSAAYEFAKDVLETLPQLRAAKAEETAVAAIGTAAIKIGAELNKAIFASSDQDFSAAMNASLGACCEIEFLMNLLNISVGASLSHLADRCAFLRKTIQRLLGVR